MPPSTTRDFDGVILAAGRGTRMMPFSERYPKPLLPILDRPLIQHQIEYLRDLGIRRILVVIGHLGHEIALGLGRGESIGVEIEYVEQRDSLGIAHAVMQLEPRIHRPFALLLGDIYFEVDRSVDPIGLMSENDAAGFLAVMEEAEPSEIQRNFAVHMDDNRVVHRVVEKPRFPRTRWKGCGLYLFDVTFFDAVRRTPRTAGRNEYELTDAIQAFLEDGEKVIANPMMTRDINLTFPYDLLVANLSALHREKLENLVHPEAKVHPDAELVDCVITHGAVVETPVSMRRCVVLPNAVVSTHEPLDRVVVTPDTLVDCRYWIDADGSVVKNRNAARARNARAGAQTEGGK